MQNTKKMQVYALLKERIENGFYSPGSRLPKEVDLAEELHVSRVTLRPALELLEIESLIHRIKGQGTFIRDFSVNDKTSLLLITHDRKLTENGIHISPNYILDILRAAERQNVQLKEFHESSLFLSDPDYCAKQILATGVQGIFWLASNFKGDEPLLKIIRSTGLPVLLPHATYNDALITGFPTLGTNYPELFQDGLKYLAAQGHQRIGYLAGNTDIRGITEDLYRSWIREMKLNPDPALLQIVNVAEYADSKFSFGQAAERLMKDTVKPPTAVICFSDYIAALMYGYCNREGIRIPDDVALLTIGGQIGCNYLNPPLSALDYDSPQIAEISVRFMLEMIREKRSFVYAVTPHKLVVRASTRKVVWNDMKRNDKKTV
ncbi:MAG: GntR family transcriptional regulator [Lentisphaeria bacterium]|nr:GntR family transcriptional regulator [Lentisphaeria bacterium]